MPVPAASAQPPIDNRTVRRCFCMSPSLLSRAPPSAPTDWMRWVRVRRMLRWRVPKANLAPKADAALGNRLGNEDDEYQPSNSERFLAFSKCSPPGVAIRDRIRFAVIVWRTNRHWRIPRHVKPVFRTSFRLRSQRSITELANFFRRSSAGSAAQPRDSRRDLVHRIRHWETSSHVPKRSCLTRLKSPGPESETRRSNCGFGTGLA
jgi:hypothetical protein